MVDPPMARRLGDVIVNLKHQLNLTSVVVTHDTHLAERLADHVIFLDNEKVLLFGTACRNATIFRTPDKGVPQG